MHTKPGARNSTAEMFIAAHSGSSAICQAGAWRQASRGTHRPIGTMRPQSSAIMPATQVASQAYVNRLGVALGYFVAGDVRTHANDSGIGAGVRLLILKTPDVRGRRVTT